MSARADASSPANAALSVAYQGWSGCIVSAGAGATPLAFDPAPGPDRVPARALVLLTHGHPEHVEGTLTHLRRARRDPVTVIASAPLCLYLEERSARSEDRFVIVAPGDRIERAGWSVRVFEWEHMPLLPPGAGAAARYLGKLLRHPRGLAQMAWSAIHGPRHAPMLGYCVRPAGAAASLVYYGEGLHRCTSPRELSEVLDLEPVDTLVFGAEPEDARALPELLASHAIGRALIFEPHREWRAAFGLPQIDLPDLVSRLRGRGLRAVTLAAGASAAPGDHSSSSSSVSSAS